MSSVCLFLLSEAITNTSHSNVEHKQAVMAEWLRRLTRNQMGSSRAGSNPADCEKFFIRLIQISAKKQCNSTKQQ